MEDLPKVLLAHLTTKRTSTWESPFIIVYDLEAIITTEVGLPTLCSTIVSNPKLNKNQFLYNLDLVEEIRPLAQIKLASYQQTTCKFYARKVKHCMFTVGDWVLRQIPIPHKKLQPNWEGSFQIVDVIGNRDYRLRGIHCGELISKTWHALYLKNYYM